MRLLALVFLLTACIGGSAQSPSPTPLDLAGEKQRADRLQARLHDYANFARYRNANTKLPPPGKGEDRVVFMGHSITDAWKLEEYFPGKPYVNRGISGQTTPQMLIRFRPDVVDLKPKVVVILAGTNDIAGNMGPMSLESIQGNLSSMVDLARANGIRTVLTSVLPISDHNKNAQGNPIVRSVQRPPEKIRALNDWIKKYCAERNLVYLDYHSATVDENGSLKAEIANDGLHPNAKGYELMKPLTEAAIRAALKTKQR